MGRRFARAVENFVCEHCQAAVTGNGYTNHCPHCLWSKHVDVNPGDRSNACGGLMEPISIITSGRKGYIITFRCVVCGQEKSNKASTEDNFEKLLEIAQRSTSGRRRL